jgi:hypothetical protein
MAGMALERGTAKGQERNEPTDWDILALLRPTQSCKRFHSFSNIFRDTRFFVSNFLPLHRIGSYVSNHKSST